MRVALIGDSQAQGLEAPMRALLGARLVDVSAHPGASTARMYSEGWLDGPEVDVVIVALGGNDDPRATYPAILAQAAQRLRARARQVVWVGPMWAGDGSVDERHNRAALVQRATLPELGVAWISGRGISQGRELAGDAVHFTRKGYTEIARAIALLLPIAPNIRVRVIGAIGVVGVLFGLGVLAAEALDR